MRHRVEMAQRQFTSRVNDVTHGVRKRVEDTTAAVLEAVQSSLDYTEDTLQPIMLAPTEGEERR